MELIHFGSEASFLFSNTTYTLPTINELFGIMN